MVSSLDVARIMGIPRVRSANDLRRVIERGVPKKSLPAVVSYIVADVREAALLKDRLVSPATYKRRGATLKPDEGERVERLARVMALAEDALGTADEAREFLQAHHPELGGDRPLDAAQTELGARQVEEILWRLEYGLPV